MQIRSSPWPYFLYRLRVVSQPFFLLIVLVQRARVAMARSGVMRRALAGLLLAALLTPAAAGANRRSSTAAAAEEVLPSADHTLQPEEGAEIVEPVAEAEAEPSEVEASGGAGEEAVEAVEKEMAQVEEEIAEDLQPSNLQTGRALNVRSYYNCTPPPPPTPPCLSAPSRSFIHPFPFLMPAQASAATAGGPVILSMKSLAWQVSPLGTSKLLVFERPWDECKALESAQTGAQTRTPQPQCAINKAHLTSEGRNAQRRLFQSNHPADCSRA